MIAIHIGLKTTDLEGFSDFSGGVTAVEAQGIAPLP